MKRKIKSSERTIALFELFSVKQKPLLIKEIAEGLGIPQSSTSQLVQSLVELGYIEKDVKARTFFPTLRISLLGSWRSLQYRRAGRLPELLSQVSKKVGEGTILAMRNGIYAQYLLADSWPLRKGAFVESEQLYPLACCATGWSILTLESPVNIQRIVQRTINEVDNERWVQSAKDCLENVRQTQKQGYALTNGHIAKGKSAISVLLPSVPGATAIAACVGGQSEEIKEKKEIILKALGELSQRVGTMAEEVNPYRT